MSSKMCVRVWLQVGHACDSTLFTPGRVLPFDWRLWVRGVNDHDISSFVHKVVFYLHPSSQFVYPKRVRLEPPYEIEESGSTSIDVPILVYLKFNESMKIRLTYRVVMENKTRFNSGSRCIYYDFKNPPEQLCKALVKGGGEIIVPIDHICQENKHTVLSKSKDDKSHKNMKNRKYRSLDPVQCKHRPKRRTNPFLLQEICSKCGLSVHAGLKKQLSGDCMTEDEITRVSQLYHSYSAYEKFEETLTLPPLSDPIYQLPELPPSLQEALKSVRFDHVLQ
ncbi:protein ENL-like [Aphomia sociella]